MSIDRFHYRGSVELVNKVVHEAGPKWGSMDLGSNFCSHPKSLYTEMHYNFLAPWQDYNYVWTMLIFLCRVYEQCWWTSISLFLVGCWGMFNVHCIMSYISTQWNMRKIVRMVGIQKEGGVGLGCPWVPILPLPHSLSSACHAVNWKVVSSSNWSSVYLGYPQWIREQLVSDCWQLILFTAAAVHTSSVIECYSLIDE